MKEQEQNLYRVHNKARTIDAYVAAENQAEAVDKVAPHYGEEHPECLSVEYVDNIII